MMPTKVCYLSIVVFVVLSLNNSYSQTPKVVIEGAIQLGDVQNPNPDPGTIRWTGTDFEGWNGTSWASLTLPEVDNNTYGVHSVANQNGTAINGNYEVGDNLFTTPDGSVIYIPERRDTSGIVANADGTFTYFNENGTQWVLCSVCPDPKPQTSVLTSAPDPETGISALEFSFTIEEDMVVDGECVTLTIKDSGGNLIGNFNGLTGNDISTFTNFNASWFPSAGVVGHGENIQFDKRQFAIDNGFIGMNANSYTIYAVLGGPCADNGTPLYEQASTENQPGYLCEMVHYIFDNDNIIPNLSTGTIPSPNTALTSTWNLFPNNGSYEEYFGLSDLVVNATDDMFLASGGTCNNIRWYRPFDNSNSSYISELVTSSQNYALNVSVPNDNLGGIDAPSLGIGILNAQIFENLGLIDNGIFNVQSPLDDCIDRVNALIALSYCNNDEDFIGFTLKRNYDNSYIKYKATPFPTINY